MAVTIDDGSDETVSVDTSKRTYAPPLRDPVAVTREDVPAASFEPDPEELVNVIDPYGQAGTMPRSKFAEVAGKGWKLESDKAAHERDLEKHAPHGALAALRTFGSSALSTATLGLSDVAARPFLGPDTEEDTARRKANSGWETAGALVGGIGPLLIGDPLGVGAVGEGAERLVAGEGSGLGMRLLGKAARGATEGGIYGAGQGVSELARSSDPLTAERAISAIGSNALYGAGYGGAIGLGAGILGEAATAGRALLGRGASLVEHDVGAIPEGKPGEVPTAEPGAEPTTAPAEHEDLATMDRAGLKAERTKALADYETGRVEQAGEVFKSATSYKDWLKSDGFIKGSTGEEKALLAKYGRAYRNSLDNPKSFADKWGTNGPLKALEGQEFAVQKMVDGGKLSGDNLETANELLGKNREMQQQIRALRADPTSARLTAIDEATATLNAPKPPPAPKSAIDELLGGSVKEKVATTVVGGGLHLLGVPSSLAYGAGRLAAKGVGYLASGKLSGLMEHLGPKMARMGARTEAAVSAFAKGGVAAAERTTAPFLSTKHLASVSYGKAPQGRAYAAASSDLAKHARARIDEVMSHVGIDQTGKTVVTPRAKGVIHDNLAGLRVINPKLAEQVQGIAEKRIEFLASKAPPRPQDNPLTGPSRWQPSELDARRFARYSAAVEDPAGILERLNHGTMSHEDAEVLQKVYRATFEAVQTHLIEKLPELKLALPYKKRVMLSTLFGVPVDGSLRPGTMARLQGHFAGGAAPQPPGPGGAAPNPKPSLGMLKAPSFTQSQRISESAG